jgi:hypothetical protein
MENFSWDTCLRAKIVDWNIPDTKQETQNLWPDIMYDGDSLNRSRMDIKRKIYYIRNWKENIYFST